MLLQSELAYRLHSVCFSFGGERTKSGIIQWMKNPKPPTRDADGEPYEGPKDFREEL